MQDKFKSNRNMPIAASRGGRGSLRATLQYATALSVVFAGALALPRAAQAYEFESNIPDLSASWTNTVTYSNELRLDNPSPTLDGANGDPNALNQNDGDNNFKSGLVSNRVNVLSDFKIKYQNVGAELSGAGFYDSIYNQKNDNTGAYAPNTTRGYNQFQEKTQLLDGRDIQLLDADVFGNFYVGGHEVTIKAGQETVQWGESLFFGANGIAGAMAPVDVNVLQAVPNVTFKQAIIPVPQVTGTFQITPKISVSAYYQFTLVTNRFPAVGSFYSASDNLFEGGSFGYNTDGTTYPRLPDSKPTGTGQFGAALHFDVAQSYCGLYLIRFDDKSPIYVPSVGLVFPSHPGPPSVETVGYRINYGRDIWLEGASFSHSFGATNIGAEASFREHQDLASTFGADTSALTHQAANNDSDNPAYASGTAFNANLSFIQNFQPSVLWPEAGMVGEIAYNRVLAITQNKAAIDPTSTADAFTMQAAFTPTYPQVLPNFDLSVPMGISYTPGGSKSLEFGVFAHGWRQHEYRALRPV
jgi:hypothetical protein